MISSSHSSLFPLGPSGFELVVEDPLVSSSEILLNPDATEKTKLEAAPKTKRECGVEVQPKWTDHPNVEEDFAASVLFDRGVDAYDSSSKGSDWDSYEDPSPEYFPKSPPNTGEVVNPNLGKAD